MKLTVVPLLFCFVAALLVSCGADDEVSPQQNRQSVINSPAFEGITDSIKRSPDNPELLLTRAVRLSQHNFHQFATPDYAKAYELTGDEGVALEYASNLLLSNNVQQAVGLLQEAQEKFPQNTEFSRRLAEIYVQMRDYNKALQEFDRILAVDPSSFEALLDKGSLLALMQDTAGAIEALEQSFSILPVNHVGMVLAQIYVNQKNPRALEICNTLLERDTASIQTEPVFMKGVYYAETGNRSKALEQFEECIQRDWKMTDAYIEKGIIYFEQKKYDEALKVFNMAATVSNTDADAYFWIGRCLEQQGNTQEAIVNYKRAIALDETFTEAKDALRRLNS